MAESSSLSILPANYPVGYVDGDVLTPGTGTLPTGTYSFMAIPWYSASETNSDFAGYPLTAISGWANVSITLGETYNLDWQLLGPIPDHISIYYVAGNQFIGTASTLRKVDQVAATVTTYTVTAAGSACDPLYNAGRDLTIDKCFISPVWKQITTMTALGQSAKKSYATDCPLSLLNISVEHTGWIQSEINRLLYWATQGIRVAVFDLAPSNLSLPITAADTGSDYFRVAGDARRLFSTARLPFQVTGSTGNNGTYHPTTVTYSESLNLTQISVHETVADGTADGNISWTGADAPDYHLFDIYYGTIANTDTLATVYKSQEETILIQIAVDAVTLSTVGG